MKNREIIFITGSKGKLSEAQSIIPTIVGKSIDLPEIQELDAKKVIAAKLQEAYCHHKGEYIVEDTSLYFAALGGLPGPLIKWFLQALGDSGLATLVRKYKNREVLARTIIGYISQDGQVKYFTGEAKGLVVMPKGEGGFGWDKIFQPIGYKKTFGQMTLAEKNKISMRKKAFTKLAKFLAV